MIKDKERIKELEDEIKVLWEDRATHSSRVVSQKKRNSVLREEIASLKEELALERESLKVALKPNIYKGVDDD